RTSMVFTAEVEESEKALQICERQAYARDPSRCHSETTLSAEIDSCSGFINACRRSRTYTWTLGVMSETREPVADKPRNAALGRSIHATVRRSRHETVLLAGCLLALAPHCSAGSGH